MKGNYASAFEAENETAAELVSITPGTMGGVVALLQYAIEADTDGEGWPDALYADDACTTTRSWQFFLMENLREALPAIVAA